MECNFENCPNFERLGKKFADRISELEQENAELQAYKDVNEDFKTAWEELKAENEALIEGLGIANKYVNKYHKTLQEIKTIAGKRSKEGLTRNYYKGLQQIIDLITKAEEE